MTGLDDKRQIRGESTIVGKSSSLLVLVGRQHVIGQLSGAHLDLALLIGLTGVLVLLGKGLGLVDGQDGANKSSVGDSAEGVAGLADLLINLETTAETMRGSVIRHGVFYRIGGILRLVVEGLEPLVVNPRVLGSVKSIWALLAIGDAITVRIIDSQHLCLITQIEMMQKHDSQEPKVSRTPLQRES